MRNLSIAICCVLLFACTSFASEKGDKYVGLDYMFLNYEGDGGSELDITASRLKMGYYFSPHFAIEGLVGIGVKDDSERGYIYYNGSYRTVDIDVELDSLMGIYLRGEISDNDKIKFYGVAGFSKIELTASALGYSESDDDSDFSLGIGFEITPNKYCNSLVVFK